MPLFASCTEVDEHDVEHPSLVFFSTGLSVTDERDVDSITHFDGLLAARDCSFTLPLGLYDKYLVGRGVVEKGYVRGSMAKRKQTSGRRTFQRSRPGPYIFRQETRERIQ